uniref:Uncharacterized protein n=1 Tax=Anguilla anguilla TaxID=7936 RepID=A0A0E9WLP9_ANGAN
MAQHYCMQSVCNLFFSLLQFEFLLRLMLTISSNALLLSSRFFSRKSIILATR